MFVVQHHAATGDHYDFRLEMEGVLRSWAVPRGPSPDPADKRFAVLTEDHPIEYAKFEGVIPEGNYGAGPVIVWDRGQWIPDGDPLEELAAGKMAFELRGYKLRGKWALIKTKRGDKDWLLIKERDSYVDERGFEIYPEDSILSGRTVEQLGAGQHAGTAVAERLAQLGAPRRHVKPASVKPMLAQSAEPFSRKGWLYEIKYDGYRLLVAREKGKATLYSRNGNDLTVTFPEIADAVAALPYDSVVLDGEVVVHDERGLPSFGLLQKRGRLTKLGDVARAAVELPVALYVFDLLAFDDYDVRPLPLVERKTALRELLPTVGPLRYSEHIERHGETMYEQMAGLGLEGIMAKKADARYIGRRSEDWLKIVVERNDDFAVVGYSDPKGGSHAEFGALLLAQFDGRHFRYAGRVGSGFKATDHARIGALLRALPAADALEAPENPPSYHWVAPELVVQVRFKDYSSGGQLRQPVFDRLREDKQPKQCLLHEEEPPVTVEKSPGDVRKVPLSNLEKVFWPDEGYTKGGLIEYYRRISPWLLPYLADRPVVLTRYPDGIEGKSFFQKNAPDFIPDWIRRETMWSEHAERELRYIVIDDLDTLLYVINMGTIPLHIWSSRVATIERPDWTILDLDPKQAPFAHVVKIAKAIHALCEDIGLPNYVKTSGSTGLHVLIPLGRQLTYDQSRSLSELIALLISREMPDIATVTRNPARRDGKVYIDFLQNRHGSTLVTPFSVRPKPGAPVSMPLRWHEVRPSNDNSKYHIGNAARRLGALHGDPMADVIEQAPGLADVLARLSELQQD